MIQHPLNSVRVGLHDYVPLLLAADPGNECRSGTNHLDLGSN